MKTLFRNLSLLLALAAIPLLSNAATDPDWTKPFPPFRIIGNIYWVGTWDLSTYLITTPKGNILINTGLAETAPQIKSNIEQLGFKLSDTKILTATHAHYDHAAGLAELKRLTKAQMVISTEDADLLASGGKTDFVFGKNPAFRFRPVKTDRRLKDGDTIELGGTVLTAHRHAGHTKGATTFTLNVSEGGKTYVVAIANMGSINPGVKVSGMPTYPGITADYAHTFEAQKAMKIDVFLASHAQQFRLHEKYKPGDPFDARRFVDPQGFHAAVEKLEKVYLDQLAAEKKAR